MEVIEAIKSRQSVRAFKPEPVFTQTLKDINDPDYPAGAYFSLIRPLWKVPLVKRLFNLFLETQH